MPEPDLLDPWNPEVCRRLRSRLAGWYRRHGRSLPWRESQDPYRVWVSEIMLQQTTVKAVIPYYERFLTRFPTVQMLAAATEAEVLQYWEGLGYYSRGRNLRTAAQHICTQHSGEMPDDLESLRRLPGIGRYTAGAIRSFAFNRPAPIVEANTLRLYCRLLGYAGDPRCREGQDLLWEFAERLQPARTAGETNQALMDLGATICTPVQPRCPECPLLSQCRAAATGEQHLIPRKAQRAEVTRLVDALVACEAGERFLVRLRDPGERWHGLWDFLRVPVQRLGFTDEWPAQQLPAVSQEVCTALHDQFDLKVRQLFPVADWQHTVTRYRIRLLCLRGTLPGSRTPEQGNWQWCTKDELQQLPMPVTSRKLARLL